MNSKTVTILLLILTSLCSCNNGTNDATNTKTPDTANKHSQNYNEATSIEGVMTNTAKFLRNHNDDLNNDRDFAEMMIYYNHAAIDMSNILLSKGNSAELIQFARESILRRKDVIKEMDGFLQKEPEEKSSSSKDFQDAVNTAVSKLRAALNFPQGDTDNLYIQSMLVFQQAGIAIAEAELQYGSHQTLKIHTRNILSAEKEELQQLQSWLKKQVK